MSDSLIRANFDRSGIDMPQEHHVAKRGLREDRQNIPAYKYMYRYTSKIQLSVLPSKFCLRTDYPKDKGIKMNICKYSFI